MVETLAVSLSGPAFSLLLYENVRSEFNQEGFLLGEIVEKETNSITDNDEQVTKIDRVIKIKSAVPCPKLGYFYDGSGKIDKNVLANFLQDEMPKVVAWYKFKRSKAFKLTVRDKIIHKQLSNFFLPPPEQFTCCLLTSSFKKLTPTHLYSQIFVRYNKMTFQNLPIHINNLSDPSNLYKTPEPCSEMFNNIYKSLNIDKDKLPMLSVITRLHTALQNSAERLVVDLAQSEEQYFTLEEEVKELWRKVMAKKLKQSAPVEKVQVTAEPVQTKAAARKTSTKLNIETRPRPETRSTTPQKG